MLPVTWSGHKDPKTICAIDSRPREHSMSSSSCLTSKMVWGVGERRGILELVRENFRTVLYAVFGLLKKQDQLTNCQFKIVGSRISDKSVVFGINKMVKKFCLHEMPFSAILMMIMHLEFCENWSGKSGKDRILWEQVNKWEPCCVQVCFSTEK